MATGKGEYEPAEEAETAPAGPDWEARWDHLYLKLSRDASRAVAALDRQSADENWKQFQCTVLQLIPLSSVLDHLQNPPR